MLVAGASLLLLLGGGTKREIADCNPNNNDCRGHVEKGEPSPDDPSATQVKYVFACAGPITGYQIQPQIPAQSIDTEVFALDRTTKQVVPTDSFSCQGIIPSYGINCTGVYGGDYEIVSGQFSIDPKLCAEPRVDPLLTVVYATRTATGVTQAMAGPFDLGRPQGCPQVRRQRQVAHPAGEGGVAPVGRGCAASPCASGLQAPGRRARSACAMCSRRTSGPSRSIARTSATWSAPTCSLVHTGLSWLTKSAISVLSAA